MQPLPLTLFPQQELDGLSSCISRLDLQWCKMVEEVMIVIQKATWMGVIKAFPIKKGEQDLGLTLSWLKDHIYIQCGWVWHPFDIVATTLHELAHKMVLHTPHHDQCEDATGHCLVWRCSAKVITAIFTEALKSSYFLSRLMNDYGVGWENRLVQS